MMNSLSSQTSSLINEESLRNLFSQFGEVVDAVICKSHVDQVITSLRCDESV